MVCSCVCGDAVETGIATGGTSVETPLAVTRLRDGTGVPVVLTHGFGSETEGFARATDQAPVRGWLRHLVADPAVLSDGFVQATARSRADGRQVEAQKRLATRLFSNGAQHVCVRDLMSGLSMPVKIVAGTQDRVVPVRHFTGLPGRIALHVFPRTGHMPHTEQRGEVARLLRELTR